MLGGQTHRRQSRDLPVLTSLRFAAAAMIVLRHLHEIVPALVPSGPLELTHGVSFFFVLSGFILTHSCIDDGSITWRNFMVRRLARIVPCHLFGFALALLLPAAMLFAPTVDGGERWLATTLKLLLLDSFATNLDDAFSLNGPSWSLSTELFFSLPFLVLLRVGMRAPWTAFALSILAAWLMIAGLRAIGIAETAAVNPKLNIVAITYLNPCIRITEFIYGMALYTVWRRYLEQSKSTAVVWSVIEIAALLCVLVWFGVGYRATFAILPEALRHWFRIAGSAPVLGLFILMMARGRGFLGRALAIRPFVWLGSISFAIYVTHYVTLKLMIAYGGPWTRLTPILVALLVMGATAHAVIETPLQRFIVRRFIPSRAPRTESTRNQGNRALAAEPGAA